MKKEKKILVMKGKHETLYFPLSTEQEQKESYLKAFKINDDMQYYWSLEDDKEEKDQEKSLENLNKTLSAVTTAVAPLNKHYSLENFLKQLKEEISRSQSYLKSLKQERQLYGLAKKGDFLAAKKLLELRSDHEYETIDVEYMS